MLPVTEDFLKRTHQIFNEFNYEIKGNVITFELFEKCAIKTLCKCENLKTVILGLKLFQYVYSHWDRMPTLIKNNFEYFKQIENKQAKLFSNQNLILKNDENIFYVSNGFSDDNKKSYFFSLKNKDQKITRIENSENLRYYFGQPVFCLRYINKKKMILEDYTMKKLCVISLDKNNLIYLAHNKLDYDILHIDNKNYFFKKVDIPKKKKERLNIDVKKSFAEIETQSFDKDKKYSASKLFVKEKFPIECHLLITLASILLM